MNEVRPIRPSDRVICACFDVTEAAIREYFKSDTATVEGFAHDTGATTKCSACKLDFELVLDSIRTGRERAARPVARHAEKISGAGIRELVDSGFLINRDGISTFLRTSNLRNPFDDDANQNLVPFDWTLRLIGEDGKLRSSRSGRLGVGESLTIDLSQERNCPDLGWFWFWMRPKAAGYFGSSRPQYGVRGPSWAATVHTQPHAWANKRKAVLIQSQRGLFQTRVSLINGDAWARVNCVISLQSQEDGSEEKATLAISPNGSRLLNIDELFPRAGERMMVANLVIESDRPTRKHVLKLQPTGQFSIDHFPDEK